MKPVSFAVSVLLLAAGSLGATGDGATTVTVNGWFSDRQCAPAKLSSDEIVPNGTICVRKCLDEGSAAVFVDPKARALYAVKDHPTVKDDVGYYLEVTGVVDARAHTISVQSVKRLGDVVQMCGRKPKKH